MTMHDLPTDPTRPLLLLGDSLDELGRLPRRAFDAVLRDPPSGIAFMGSDWDNLRGYTPRGELGERVLAGLALLGLGPAEAGFVAFVAEVSARELDVVKPGAHSLTWSLPRTADLTTLGLRLAGWEIRRPLVHLFGDTRAKGATLDKAIDRAAGAERPVVGRYMKPEGPAACAWPRQQRGA